MYPKFVQITALSERQLDDHDNPLQVAVLYALDEVGDVWWAEPGRRWQRLNMRRVEEAGAP